MFHRTLNNLGVTSLVVSFSGTRTLDHSHPGWPLVQNLIDTAAPARGYVTGACVGFDTVIGEAMARAYPDAEHLVIVPANRGLVDVWWRPYPFVEVREMPAGSSYADRNAALVAAGDATVAFPDYPENHPRSRRSGTWQTVRMAHRANKIVLVQPLREA